MSITESNTSITEMNMAPVPKKKIYLAGRIAGEKDGGIKAFADATKYLENCGFEVFNPTLTPNEDRNVSMTIDFNYIINEADAVVLLDNWKASPGAKAEVVVANNVGKPVLDISTLDRIREKVEVVVGDYIVR